MRGKEINLPQMASQSGAGAPPELTIDEICHPARVPSPIGADVAMRSANPSSGMLFRRQNTMMAMATPSMPPWKLMPPSQTARICRG